MTYTHYLAVSLILLVAVVGCASVGVEVLQAISRRLSELRTAYRIVRGEK